MRIVCLQPTDGMLAKKTDDPCWHGWRWGKEHGVYWHMESISLVRLMLQDSQDLFCCEGSLAGEYS
jgi:hypothetical protein